MGTTARGPRTHSGARHLVAAAAVPAAAALALSLAVAPATAATRSPSIRSTPTVDARTFPRLAAGLTFTVDTSTDAADVNPASGPCADTQHRCSIRAAMDIGNARQVPVTIKIPAGTFTLGFSLVDDDAAGISFIGASSATTTLSGNGLYPPIVVGDGSTLGLSSSVSGVPASIQSLTVANGHSFESGPWTGEGGCVLVVSPNNLVEMTGVHVHDCVASSQGGGIWSVGRIELARSAVQQDDAASAGGGIYEDNGLLTVSASSITSNTVDDATGVAQGAGAWVAAPCTVTATTVADNVASGQGAYGAGLYLGGTSTLADDVVSGNRAEPVGGTATSEGAGLWLNEVATISGTTIADNVATGQNVFGGGIFSMALLTVADAHVTANHATATNLAEGGGIYATNSATASATTFTGDVAESPTLSFGGAVYDADSTSVAGDTFTNDTAVNGAGGGLFSASSATVAGSTFSGDRATGGVITSPTGAGFGGAVAADGQGLRLTDDVLAHDHADQGGGGLWNQAYAVVDHTVIEDDTANEGAGIYNWWLVFGSADALVDNTASGPSSSGGGLIDVGTVGTSFIHSTDLMDSVIAGNVASEGPGVYFEGGASASAGGTFTDDFIGGNRTATGAAEECGFGAALELAPASGGGNVVGDASCGLTGATDRRGPAEAGLWFATAAGAVAARRTAAFGHSGGPVAAIAAADGNGGYWELRADGAVHGFGTAPSLGGATAKLQGGTATAIASTLDRGGYWVTSSTGAVVAVGDAPALGGAPGHDVVGIARSVDGAGYELLEATGRVLALGDAPHLASHAGIHASSLAMTPDGQGYWEVSTTGHVYAFGDAHPFGSTAATGVIGIFSTPDGRGYLVVTDHGEIVTRGDAHSPGNASGTFAAAAAT